MKKIIQIQLTLITFIYFNIMISHLLKDFVNTDYYHAIFFLMMRTADIFFIADGSQIFLEEIDSDNRRIYVSWSDSKFHHHYIGFDDLSTVLECIFNAFGRNSHSYREWNRITFFL